VAPNPGAVRIFYDAMTRPAAAPDASDPGRVLDDPSRAPFMWRFIADRVMGGLSTGQVTQEIVDGRPAVRLTGLVSTANSGGFIQAARPLVDDGGRPLAARATDALELTVCGNGETYNVHLRTPDVERPWQSYRAHFLAPRSWTLVTLPLAAFVPHRIDIPLDTARLTRLGIVAIGRDFEADVALAGIRLVRKDIA